MIEWISIVLDHPQFAFWAISLYLAYHIVKTFVKSTKGSIQTITHALISLTRIVEGHERNFKSMENRKVDKAELDDEFRKLNNLPVIKYQDQ